MITQDYKSTTTNTRPTKIQPTLRQHIMEAAKEYLDARTLSQLEEEPIYKLFREELERGLFEAVLRFSHGNESRASRILDISRGTLRSRRRSFGHYSVEKKGD
jgi:Fis family transcriptional regulator, factor for inversion stimulation protein